MPGHPQFNSSMEQILHPKPFDPPAGMEPNSRITTNDYKRGMGEMAQQQAFSDIRHAQGLDEDLDEDLDFCEQCGEEPSMPPHECPARSGPGTLTGCNCGIICTSRCGCPQIHGANQAGSSLITSGWMKKPHVEMLFRIADVFDVQPLTKSTDGLLKVFCITEVKDEGGVVTLGIYPPLIDANNRHYQNVSGLPADGALIYPEWVRVEKKKDHVK